MAEEAQAQEASGPVLPIAATAPVSEQKAILPGSQSFDGVDRPQMDPQNFLGFPVVDTIPTYDDIEGKVVLYDDGSSIRRLYIFIGGAWRAFAPYLGAFAEIYLGSGTKTLTCTNAGQAYLIGDGNGVGTNGITGGGATADQSNWRVTPPAAANFRITLSVSFSVDRTCKLDIYADQGGSALTNVYAEKTISATSTIYTVSISGLAALTANSVQPKVVSDTAGAVITWERINLHIVSV